MDLGLKDKCAFVAGSSRGLGYTTALFLVKEGCRVVINSRDEEKVKAAAEAISKGTGMPAFGVVGDVSDAAAETADRIRNRLTGRARYPDHKCGRSPGRLIRGL